MRKLRQRPIIALDKHNEDEQDRGKLVCKSKIIIVVVVATNR
jgi:hypothetical protein|tara:strand:+ start:91 stop:216 length:126 start_codon:yes stop_codon:yes gene_type:complete